MKGIFYLTFNGIFNNTNGVGTQTKVLLEGFDYFYDKFTEKYGDVCLNLVTPRYEKDYPSYCEEDYSFAKAKMERWRGEIFFCKMSERTNNFWTTEYWHSLCAEAADIIKREASKYEEVVVICIDMPFLHTPIYFEKLNPEVTNVKWLLTFYSSSYIHDKDLISDKRLAWEYVGISASRFSENIYLADVCDFMKSHLIEYYGAPQDKFISYESSLFLQSKDFSYFSEDEIKAIMQSYNIPQDKDILLSFGRAVWIKGFDILLKSLPQSKKDFHLVMILVSPPGEISTYKECLDMAKNIKQSFTLIPNFSRILPKALCQWPRTKVVVCPSRGEPFSNIPLETGIWAKEKGPIVLASNIDGYLEQVKDGDNGFLFECDSSLNLAQKIDHVFSLSDKTIYKMRKNAYKKVMLERDFFKNFEKTLDQVWTKKE